MSKTIYQYDQDTGAFVGTDLARESPLEPGVFLIPAGATETAPPACSEGERPVFKNGDWVIAVTPTPTPDPLPTPEEIKAEKWKGIKAERDRRKVGGVKVGAKWFHSDDASRIQQLALVMMGAGLPAGLQWKTMDGSFITMTPALAQQVFTGQAASDQAIFAVAEQHRVAMEASADPAAYDFSTGWPKVFGEA